MSSKSLTLSVLDQSLARTPEQASQALHETLEMARWCEQLGYERFWVSEHHAFPSVAGSAPEILLAALGAATSTIRLGSGGIMLPHYSAYKVAEQFSLLANLYPDRIDLGVGRAPGADMSTATVLATDGRPKFERFPALVSDLCGFLRDEVSQPLVSPKPPKALPVWMLGSSLDSAQLAAERGLPYNLAAFINPQADPRLIQYYRERFQADHQSPPIASKVSASNTDNQSTNGKTPYSILTISVFCADEREHAKLLQQTHDINLFRFFTGQSNGVAVTPEQAADYPIGPQLADFMRSRDDTRAVGTPAQVKEKVLELANRFGVDEIMAVTNIYYLKDRKRSFELLMQAMSEG